MGVFGHLPHWKGGIIGGSNSAIYTEIQSSQVSADLTDYVCYLDLSIFSGVDNFWNALIAGGGNIRIYKSDGITELAREIVSVDEVGRTGEVHFKYTGTLSSVSDTGIYIVASSMLADYAVTDTYGRNAVWGTNYKTVIHRNNDSTQYQNNSSNGTNLPIADATGKLGTGKNFDSTEWAAYAANDTPISTNDAFISVWFEFTENQKSFFGDQVAGIWGRGYYGGSVQGMGIGLVNNGFGVQVRNGATFRAYFGATSLKSTGWNLGHLTFDRDGGATGIKAYLNGTQVATLDASVFSGVDFSGAYNLRYGVSSSIGTEYKGRTDEPRYGVGWFPDANWIATEYNNQNSPNTFYSSGIMTQI